MINLLLFTKNAQTARDWVYSNTTFGRMKGSVRMIVPGVIRIDILSPGMDPYSYAGTHFDMVIYLDTPPPGWVSYLRTLVRRPTDAPQRPE